MSASSPNPAELRMILARNLQQLMADTGNVSELCRQIGVNRTQFNRYLAGTAFPRPDVLHRICRHFDVDANILLNPLNPPSRTAPPQPMLAEAWAPPSTRPFDHYLMPDGLYRYWRKSFRQPQRAYLGMALITTKGDTKLWKGYDLHDQPMRSGGVRFARSSRYDGQLIQQFDGVTLVSKTPYSDVMNLTYFEYGLDGLMDYFSGISFITRRRLPDSNRFSAIVLQKLPRNTKAVLACARRCGSHDMKDLLPVIQNALNRVPDFI